MAAPPVVAGSEAHVTSALSTEAKVLAAYLARHCVGRARARPQPRIREDLAAAGVSVSERDIFDLEAELVAARVPLGTCGRGVYLCDEADEQDFKVAYGYLVSRFGPIRDRAEALESMRAERFDEPEPPEPARTFLFDPYGMDTQVGDSVFTAEHAESAEDGKA